ncbi:hypothetical protein ACFPN7_47535 [Amycolatopsis halotolerans]
MPRCRVAASLGRCVDPVAASETLAPPVLLAVVCFSMILLSARSLC